VSPELFVFLALAGGLVATVVLVVGGLALTGHVKFVGVAGMVSQLKQRVPELAGLSEDQQAAIVKRSLLLPSLLALGALMAFMMFAVTNLSVLNFINASHRNAGIVGIMLLVAIVLPFKWLQATLVRRKIKRLTT
jgi:hypothetical protein